ncbi:MAG: SpaA isopeptide-forming pilin-related protein, partial [Oscillospiraceae bacterium]|nr:SpaA isopeptide-forming pilin-related protein [Oscillospiraceae bacterium]
RYRVRLKNENNDFVENNTYPTNDTTTLEYRYFETKDGVIQVSDLKTVEFPIPAVKGYLADLTFQKTDSNGDALAGAEFTLRHDDKNCSACRGNGGIVDVPEKKATSDENGKVTFQNIPSGHKYVLEETKVPAGYSPTGNTYLVTVAYDALNVTVTAHDGSSQTWNGKIVNNVYYELPATGGSGTKLYTVGGLLLIAAAGILLYIQKKRGKEGVASS